MNLKNIGFYFITDSILTKKGVMDDVKEALDAGVKIVQYREKKKSTREMLYECRALRDLCRGRALFMVNDRIDIALAANADGVHLGQEDMPYPEARLLMGGEKIIGLTVHNEKEAIDAEKSGADYVGASPVFETRTKSDAGKQAGLQLVRNIKRKVEIPVVAIGGINLENVLRVMDAGADSVCAISAVIGKGLTGKECKKFVDIINSCCRKRITS